MEIIQLIRDYLNGEKMPERIRYGMMQDGYQYFRWDAEAEEYVCEADDKCFLSQVPWHHLRDFVEVAEQTEPQTETEIAKAIVHKMIDDAVIAEDAYPDLRQKMHDAVDEYEPQTERNE